MEKRGGDCIWNYRILFKYQNINRQKEKLFDEFQKNCNYFWSVILKSTIYFISQKLIANIHLLQLHKL